MYSYSEIRLQNKQDAFSAMYMCISRSILEICGSRTGEKICRQALRSAGEKSGIRQREKFLKAGVKTNLKTLFSEGLDYIPDPRFKGQVMFDEEERQIYEIYSCPMAAFWNEQGAGRIGSFFCEEYQYARVKAFTGQAGQYCLSNYLTCDRDHFCHISAFYRPANVSKEQAALSFSAEGGAMEKEKQPVESVSFDEGIHDLSLGVYTALLHAAREVSGQEGVCAVAEGLKNWAAQAVPALKQQAVKLYESLDEAFIGRHFPIPVDSQTDMYWTKTEEEARRLMQSLVLDPVRAAAE